MLFHDVSCESEHTIEGHRRLGVYELLGADWAGIVVISRRLTVRVDASVDLSGTCTGFALSFLEAHKEELSTLVFSPTNYRIFPHLEGQVVVSFDRETEEYVVLSIYCKEQGTFEEKDIRWSEIYTAANYKNVLLNNELVQDKDYLENVLESCESAIVVFDLNGSAISCNRLAEEIFGADLADLGHQAWSEGRNILTLIQHVVETEEKQYLYNVRPLNHDPSRVFNATLAPLRNSKNVISGAVLVCIDRTEQEYMQQEMELLKHYGLMGEISLGLAHDVKNPLMNIRCCTSLLKKNPALPEWPKEMCGIIDHEVDRISGVIDQMMSFGNMATETSRKYISIDEVLYDCIQIVKRQRADKDILFHQQRSDDLPLIMGKKVDLQQVFLNILINAAQAIKRTGEIRVATAYDPDTCGIHITIRDTGEGMSPEVAQKIFEPYFSTKPNGTGLGLFVAQRTLARFGGSIRFESPAGGGTICHMVLPCQGVETDGGNSNG